MLPRPIHCVDCGIDFRPEKNGVWLLEEAKFGPYCLWACDLWKCPKCGKEIIAGYGQKPTYHHEENFESLLAYARSRNLYVNREGA